MKTRINENQKVTLTIGQLKKLVNESGERSVYDKLENDILTIIRREIDRRGEEVPYGLDIRLSEMLANHLMDNWIIKPAPDEMKLKI